MEDFLFEGGDLISEFAVDFARNLISVGKFNLVGNFDIHEGAIFITL